MDETEHEKDELEISEIPDRRKSGGASTIARVLAARPRLRSCLWQAGIAALALCLILVVFPDFYPLLRTNLSALFARTPQASPAAAPLPSTRVVIEDVQSQFNGKKVLIWDASTPPVIMPYATLDATPTACPQNTQTQKFDAPPLPPGVGGGPLWVTGFTGSRAVLNHLARAHPPQLGWYQQIQLVGASNFSGAITLQGGIAGSTFPLWFGFDPHEKDLIFSYQYSPADSSLSNHTTDDQQWIVRPINLYIPQAGCYYLQATWDGGSWTAYFAAGK